MDVSGQDDFLVGLHRGHDHREDAATGAVDQEESLVGAGGVREKLFRF